MVERMRKTGPAKLQDRYHHDRAGVAHFALALYTHLHLSQGLGEAMENYCTQNNRDVNPGSAGCSNSTRRRRRGDTVT